MNMLCTRLTLRAQKSNTRTKAPPSARPPPLPTYQIPHMATPTTNADVASSIQLAASIEMAAWHVSLAITAHDLMLHIRKETQNTLTVIADRRNNKRHLLQRHHHQTSNESNNVHDQANRQCDKHLRSALECEHAHTAAGLTILAGKCVPEMPALSAATPATTRPIE
jgi:hypothetical protein